jgi:hypothetical protein
MKGILHFYTKEQQQRLHADLVERIAKLAESVDYNRTLRGQQAAITADVHEGLKLVLEQRLYELNIAIEGS